MHVCVKHCRFVGLNALQGTSQRVLVLSRRMHRKGAKTDNGYSYHHCCDQTCCDFNSELLHKLPWIRVIRITVNKKTKKFTGLMEGGVLRRVWRERSDDCLETRVT